MVKNAAFVDTSGWYALVVATDPHHQQAAQIYGRLKSELSELVSTDWVLLETAALLHNRINRSKAQETVSTLLNNSQVQIVWMDEELGRLAAGRYRSLQAGVSLVDAGSFACMEKLQIKRALAFDRDFEAQGYRLEN